MDPQQRKCLEAGTQAFDDAELDLTTLGAVETAVYAGVMTYDWMTLKSASNAMAMPDSPQMLANRVSFMLGLMGPSMTIDTACSSSLVATSNAASEVVSGRCGLGLALGVCWMGIGDTYFNRCALRLLSVVGRSMAFNTDADGYCRGEAFGALLLGRCGDAPQHTALLAGSSVNEDGRSATLTAPNGPAQSALLRDCHKVAGMLPAEIMGLECAANGSQLGDPIEYGASERVHGSHLLVLSSGKSNKGHTEGGSGMTGLVKGTLLLQHLRAAPAIVHMRALNANIEAEAYQAIFPDEPVALTSRGETSSMGVSAFGFGGTNAHAILSRSP